MQRRWVKDNPLEAILGFERTRTSERRATPIDQSSIDAGT
jgi:hypothetical protein